MNINDIMAGMTPAELAEFNAAGNANPLSQQQYNISNTNTIYGNNNTIVNGNQNTHFHVKLGQTRTESYWDETREDEIRQEALEDARQLINNTLPLWKEKGFSSQKEYQESLEKQRQINSFRLMSLGRIVTTPIVGLAKLLWWTALTINGNNPYQTAQRKQQLLSGTPISDKEAEDIIETTVIEEKDRAEARKILQAPPPKGILDEYQKQSRTPVEKPSSNSIYSLIGGK